MHNRKFSCSPEERDQIFIPACGSARNSSPQFPSPTTCLSEPELEKLERSIDKANRILLALGAPEESDKNLAFFNSLQKNRKSKIIVEMACPETVLDEGCLEVVGRDFLLLQCGAFDGFRIIPYENINKLTIKKKRNSKKEKKILDADPCLRRNLVLNFGATVANSPFLIDEFFGLSLSIMLLFFEEKKVAAILPNEHVEGVLSRVDAESICIENDGQRTVIPFLNICELLIE